MIYYFHILFRERRTLLFLILGSIFLLGWSIGYSGIASVFGISAANGIIKYRTAAILSAVFVFAGAYFGGYKGLENVNSMIHIENLELKIVIAISAALTGIILAQFGISVSITQGIIGALVAAGFIAGDINLKILFNIVLGWVLTPLGGVLFGFLFYKSIRPFFNKIKSLFIQQIVVKMFALIVGIYGSYALGANNFAVVAGPFFDKQTGASLLTILTIGALSMSVGALIYSRKIADTVGKKITVLEPVGVIVAMFAQSTTVWIYSLFGIPVSASQAIVGGVIGVGFAGNSHFVSWKTMLKMILGWLITPLMSGLIVTVVHFLLFRI